ncbi:hypothetical protein [Candidatus Oscillochloris fontis]|uniref:hypothetical protein n=1 Tax=Candidatus Oscillochloris fontis TaxID=2496868 RepID=UPI00101C5C6C|nr:hypothetical protein [Candidatus Oscillochloris fontis]
MERKTQGVYDLVERVLQTMNTPYSEDIIEEVFLAIETHTDWLQNYNKLNGALGTKVVHSWIGQYVKEITAMKTIREVSAKRSHLIKDYTKLSY